MCVRLKSADFITRGDVCVCGVALHLVGNFKPGKKGGVTAT